MENFGVEGWQPATSQPGLQPGQVHLWQARLTATRDEDTVAWSVLSAEELARAGRFRFEQHRVQFVRAHAFTRGILALYAESAPVQLKFRTTAAGKPYLVNAGIGLRFNLSHSADLLVLAVCLENELGVDIESHAQALVWRDIASSYFSPTEIAAIESGLAEESRVERFFRAWTVKEAYLKAQGGGLMGGLEQVEVELGTQAGARFLRLPGGESEKKRWQVLCFQPASVFSGALVTESGAGPWPKLMRFTAGSLTEISV